MKKVLYIGKNVKGKRGMVEEILRLPRNDIETIQESEQEKIEGIYREEAGQIRYCGYYSLW